MAPLRGLESRNVSGSRVRILVVLHRQSCPPIGPRKGPRPRRPDDAAFEQLPTPPGPPAPLAHRAALDGDDKARQYASQLRPIHEPNADQHAGYPFWRPEPKLVQNAVPFLVCLFPPFCTIPHLRGPQKHTVSPCSHSHGNNKSSMHSSSILTIAAALGCVLACASAAPMTDAQVRRTHSGRRICRKGRRARQHGLTRHG